MDVFEAIEARRAVKHFDPDHRMTDAEIDRLMSAALLAPTAFNIQNTRFVLVRDPELRRKIRAVAWDQAQVTDASLLLVLCADIRAWAKDPARYWSHAPQEVRDFLVPAIGQYYEGRERVQRDEAMRSCGLAAQTIMLAAQAMGYESCPMDGFDFDAVAELVRLPEDHAVAMFVVVGKGTKEPWPRGGAIPRSESIVVDGF